MAAITAQVLLDQVNQAISDLLTTGVTGWTDSGKTVTLNDLSRLQRLRQTLLAEVGSDNRTTFRIGVPLR